MKNLFLYFSLFMLLAACSKNAVAQDTCCSHTKKKDWVVGYAAGEQMLLGNTPPTAKYAFTNTVSGRKNIDDRWSIDMEISLSVVKRQTTGNEVTITNEGVCKEYNVSVPVTVEYNFLPKDSKVRPFVGAGVQYNVYQENYSEYDFYDGLAKKITSTKTYSPYASFVITQGVTYDISPRIQIKESIHFLPQINTHNNSVIGASIGIGFKF